MSRRMLMMAAMSLAAAVGATSSFAARLVQAPAGEPVFSPFQPPEPRDPPPPPREGGRDQPGPMRGGDQMRGPMGLGGGIQMTASGKFVYILRGDEILQFDAITLEFVKMVKLPAPERQNRGEGERGDRRPPRNNDKPPPRDDP